RERDAAPRGAPRAAPAARRDHGLATKAHMSARAEVYEERVWLKRAVLVLIWLAGIAGVLWTPVGGKVLNDVTLDWIDVLVWGFIGGGIYGAVVYFGGGLVLYWLTRAVGGITDRQVRHVLGFAGAPVALSLCVVWPARIAV